MSLTSQPNCTVHLHGLDLVRVAAALGVGLFHLTWRYPPLAGGPPLGWIGVEVFFVLSGIVIAGSVQRTSPGDFLARRALRLYPTAWLCALIGVAAIGLFGGRHAAVGVLASARPAPLVASLTLFGDGFVGSAFWTLPIELSFYLVVFAVAAAGYADRLPWLAKALVLWSAPYVLAFSGLLAAGGDVSSLDIGYGPANMALLRHSHFFGLGMLLWLARPGRGRGLWPWIAGAGFLGVLEIACRAHEIGVAAMVAPATIGTACAVIWVASCAVMTLAIRRHFTPAHDGARRVVRTLGLATYPFYLLHEAVGGNVMAALLDAGVGPKTSLGAALFSTGVFSIVVARYLEPSTCNLLRALGREMRPAVPSGL